MMDGLALKERVAERQERRVDVHGPRVGRRGGLVQVCAQQLVGLDPDLLLLLGQPGFSSTNIIGHTHTKIFNCFRLHFADSNWPAMGSEAHLSVGTGGIFRYFANT